MGNGHQHRCLPAVALAVLLTACTSPPSPVAKPDPATVPEYQQKVERLARLNRQSADLIERNKLIDAGEQITVGQSLVKDVLEVPNPSLAAMEAASDCDDLYARILLSKHQTGYARMVYQKNQSRWRNWTPQTENTKRRLAEAQAGIAECDQRIRRARRR